MSPRPFLIYPDKRLLTPALPVSSVDDDVRSIWEEMLAAMYAMPGVGLAAPQLGIPWRLAVVDCDPANPAPVRMANPELLEMGEEVELGPEGSPNLPGLTADVPRATSVRVRFLDAEGAVLERRFDGLWARSVQHQIDHLGGRLYVDRLRPVKRRLLLARHAKSRRTAERG
ncbi:MAG: peptide deformylase [Pseudomonadota bacterium]